jgi:hypothetical protein
MKTKFFAVVAGTAAALVLVSGCVNTVSGRKTAGVPFVRDTFSGQYDRPVDQVFQAAKSVVGEMGTLSNEGTLYDQTNTVVKTVEGRVNQCKVWVRVEQIDPKTTGVAVQTRTRGGGSDVDLAHQIDKEIAVKLASGK